MIDNLRENFRKNLNRLLSETDKKQVDIAKYVGVSTATVNEWCKGRKAKRSTSRQKARLCRQGSWISSFR